MVSLGVSYPNPTAHFCKPCPAQQLPRSSPEVNSGLGIQRVRVGSLPTPPSVSAEVFFQYCSPLEAALPARTQAPSAPLREGPYSASSALQHHGSTLHLSLPPLHGHFALAPSFVWAPPPGFPLVGRAPDAYSSSPLIIINILGTGRKSLSKGLPRISQEKRHWKVPVQRAP